MTKNNKSDENKWIKIGPLPGILYAEMVAEVLKEKEIPFNISQDGIATAYGFAGTNLAGNQAFIYVPEEFEEEVQSILDQMIDSI